MTLNLLILPMLACLYCQCVLLNDHAIPPALWNGQWKHVLGWASTASEITFATLWKIKHFEISAYSWGQTALVTAMRKDLTDSFYRKEKEMRHPVPQNAQTHQSTQPCPEGLPLSHQWGFPMEQAGGCCSISHVCAGQLCPCSCANHHNSRTGCTHVKISS